MHTRRPRVPIPADGLQIHLTELEERLCTLVDECCKHSAPDVEARIAGGWVRDKVPQSPAFLVSILTRPPV